MTAMIEVEGLTKLYGDFVAVDNISFHAEQGEILGFLGPNGAGKTTTMRILAGFMPPSEGRAAIAGMDVFEESFKARQRLGYLPETVPLYEEMTVWDYVSYMAELHQVAKRDEAVEEALDMVDLWERADSFISNLSKGMRQRVGLAQALVHKPEVLILDEPTIGLDPRQIREIRDVIRNIGADRTVMLSTHILPEVSQLCTRVLIIDNGRIVAEDTPDKLAESLQGSTKFRVRVAGDTKLNVVARELLKVEHVETVEVTENGLEVFSGTGKDARPAVSAAVVNNGWDLIELSPLGMSLEDIFLQLTDEDEDDYEDGEGYETEEEEVA